MRPIDAADVLATGQMVVAGDFNVGFPTAREATFFDKRRRELGWHIDYILMRRDQLHRVRNVELGDFWEWVASGRSDHVALIVDLDW